MGIDPTGTTLAEMSRELEAQGLGARDLVLVFTAAGLGGGDADLGRTLMRNMLCALQETAPPRALIFMNSGVRLVCPGAPALDALASLGRQGTEVLACAESLHHYGLQPSVGEATNMYRIVDLITSARRVVTF